MDMKAGASVEASLVTSAVVKVASETGRDEGIRAEEFDALVRLYQKRIFRLLMSLLRDTDAADTLTQECFLRAFRARATFRGGSSHEAWLVRIAVHLATDHLRSRRREFWKRLFYRQPSEGHSFAELEVADSQPSPERAFMARENAERVWAAVEKLPRQQRSIFLLRFVEEMSLDDMASAMSLEVGTVKSHLHRALAFVRARLREEGIR
jgi:RNA polymerase sigma-70 factor (ECF subfamily)